MSRPTRDIYKQKLIYLIDRNRVDDALLHVLSERSAHALQETTFLFSPSVIWLLHHPNFLSGAAFVACQLAYTWNYVLGYVWLSLRPTPRM